MVSGYGINVINLGKQVCFFRDKDEECKLPSHIEWSGTYAELAI